MGPCSPLREATQWGFISGAAHCPVESLRSIHLTSPRPLFSACPRRLERLPVAPVPLHLSPSHTVRAELAFYGKVGSQSPCSPRCSGQSSRVGFGIHRHLVQPWVPPSPNSGSSSGTHSLTPAWEDYCCTVLPIHPTLFPSQPCWTSAVSSQPPDCALVILCARNATPSECHRALLHVTLL